MRSWLYVSVSVLLFACSKGSDHQVSPNGGSATGGVPGSGGQGSGGAGSSGQAGAGPTGGKADAGGAAGVGGSVGSAGQASRADAGATGGQGGGGAGADGGSGGSGAGHTFDIRFDYKFDSTNAFTPERRAALEAGAAIWASLVLDDFPTVPAGTALRTRDPEHFTDPGVVFTTNYDIDDIAIFVGFAMIDGPQAHLAESSNSFTNQVTDAALLAKLDARYNMSPFQPWLGSTRYEPVENWFYDPTPGTDDDVPAAQDDFVTTAAHEIGHLLGIGYAAAFDALVSNGSFTGSHAVAVNGGPVLLSSDLHHIDKTVLTAGKRSLMDNGTPAGVRVHPTALDLAILEDLGYHIRH